MDVDPGGARRPGSIGQAWRATLRARRADRVYLGLTTLAFVLGVVDSATSGTLATVMQMAMVHGAFTANGVAGRRAQLREAPDGSWQPRLLIGRLLGVLTMSSAFCVILLVTASLVLSSHESMAREGLTALSGLSWVVSVVFLFSTFLPRRADSVAALVLWYAGVLLYQTRTQFTHPAAARAVEAIWENIGVLVVFSDASPGASAWTDLGRWASNITVAIIAGLIMSYLRRGLAGRHAGERRGRWMLATAAGLAISARLLVPRVEDQVTWVEFGSPDARIEAARPVLYNFTAEWCAICDRLERDLFAERGDARWINERFVPVRVLDRKREDGHNTDAVEALRARFNIDGFPTLIVQAPDGRVLSRIVGYSGNLTEVRQVLGQSVK